VRKQEIPATALIRRYIIPPTGLNHIALHRMTIVGEMGSGKTTLAMRLAELCLKELGYDNVNIVISPSLEAILKKLDERMVQFLILDDPLWYHFSRGFDKERRAQVSKLAVIRHIWRRKFKKTKGLIVLITITQYYYALDPFFRNAPLIIFKTVLNEPRDRWLLRKLVGMDKYRELAKITFRMFFKQDDNAKSKALAKPIGHKPIWIKYSLPKLEPEKYYVEPEFREREGREAILDEIDNMIIRMRLEGMSLRAIAKEVNISHTAVFKRIQKLREMGLYII